MNPATHQVSQWTWGNSSGQYFVLAPADFAAQYDLQPLYNASVNGAGQTIAIINESNINIDLVNQFRTLFNLPANPPQVIIDGNDPGVDGINNPDGPNGASPEAYLDVEWAGAVAPNATIDLVIAADTSIEGGLVLAMEHAVYSNIAPVLSISFGSCESALGASNAFINSLWEQAAAQGQTVMVSSGDNGSAGCDNENSVEYASQRPGRERLRLHALQRRRRRHRLLLQPIQRRLHRPQRAARHLLEHHRQPSCRRSRSSNTSPSSPGTTASTGSTSSTSSPADGTTTIAGGSGGASNAAICSSTYNTTTGACNGTLSGYPKPAWQSGAGVPSDSVRDMPDVSLFAANGSNDSFYPICATDGDCQTAGLSSGSSCRSTASAAPPPPRPPSPASWPSSTRNTAARARLTTFSTR